MTSRVSRGVFAFCVAFAAQAADTVTTIYGISRGASESNPLMESVISGHGFVWFALVKFSAVLYFTALTFWSRTMAVAFALPFFYFAIHNLRVIASL
jgi:hypothetical protein